MSCDRLLRLDLGVTSYLNKSARLPIPKVNRPPDGNRAQKNSWRGRMIHPLIILPYLTRLIILQMVP